MLPQKDIGGILHKLRQCDECGEDVWSPYGSEKYCTTCAKARRLRPPRRILSGGWRIMCHTCHKWFTWPHAEPTAQYCRQQCIPTEPLAIPKEEGKDFDCFEDDRIIQEGCNKLHNWTAQDIEQGSHTKPE